MNFNVNELLILYNALHSYYHTLKQFDWVCCVGNTTDSDRFSDDLQDELIKVYTLSNRIDSFFFSSKGDADEIKVLP